MSLLAIIFVWIGIGALLFAIAYQLDLMEIRWERRNRERAEQWQAGQRGSARVVDFEQYLASKRSDRDERGAA